jgi:hypothetical protein
LGVAIRDEDKTALATAHIREEKIRQMFEAQMRRNQNLRREMEK